MKTKTTKEVTKRFLRVLNSLKIEHNITQRAIAEQMGLSEATLSRVGLKDWQKNASVTKILQLKSAFKEVDLNYIFGYSDTPFVTKTKPPIKKRAVSNYASLFCTY